MKATTTKDQAMNALAPKLRFPEFRDAEGWNVKPFRKLFTIGSGRDYKHLSAGSVPVFGSGGYMLSVDDFLYDGESVCIGRKGTINNPMFLTGKFWTVDTLFYTHSFRDCLPKFIYAIFQNIDWLKHNEAGGVPSLSKAIIERIQIAVPGTAEQQKIAACLGSLDELIAAQRRKVEALKTHKTGLMQQLFPREGETQPRLRFPEFLGAPEWEVKKLEDLAKRGSGHTPNKLDPEHYNGGIKWISLADSKRLDVGLISKTEHEISAKGIKNSSAVLHPAGTVLISRDAGVGKSAIMALPMAVSQHFIVWTCHTNLLSNWFLYYQLQQMKPIFERIATGSTIKTIGLPFFKELLIAVPTLPEQQRIADCLSSLDALITAATQTLDTLKTHKQGLMQQLFPSMDLLEA